MKPLTEVLIQIDDAIERYQTLDLKMVSDQSEILQQLTTSLYDLAKHRVDYHEKFNSVYLNSQAKTNAAKEKEAELRVPELYKIKHLDRKAEKVADTIRTTIATNRQR